MAILKLLAVVLNNENNLFAQTNLNENIHNKFKAESLFLAKLIAYWKFSLTMNGRTRWSGNVDSNRRTINKKRKSITENNIEPKTKGSKATTSSANIRNITMTGKTTGHENQTDSDSNISGYGYSSYSKSSSGLDDNQDKEKNKTRKKRRSQYDNMDFLVKSVLNMTKSMNKLQDHSKRMEEKVSRFEEVIA